MMHVSGSACVEVSGTWPGRMNYTSGMANDFTQLTEELRAFVRARDWEQYHSPKNLAMALSVEVAELVEHFQWLTAEASGALAEEVKEAVAEEVADVQIYLLQLANRLDIDVLEAVKAKMVKNGVKYPVPMNAAGGFRCEPSPPFSND